ncbi:hypothetical protein Nepgr_018710 [Nepenthes gracilis]|uniref:Uncharacterized protein n=1 Tax=Nepenthes gracilis TaxID=150966 RepID=A0AAD3STW7_NEPGR|nr:hypothetical protein Nepgr_018710 [Nepenthes gracilis]
MYKTFLVLILALYLAVEGFVSWDSAGLLAAAASMGGLTLFWLAACADGTPTYTEVHQPKAGCNFGF